uniref:Uncharacterized protein n=1 Tax=Opuntia streptacantha TaxID=393608 RepID=A0A7C8ZWV4_OPUST
MNECSISIRWRLTFTVPIALTHFHGAPMLMVIMFHRTSTMRLFRERIWVPKLVYKLWRQEKTVAMGTFMLKPNINHEVCERKIKPSLPPISNALLINTSTFIHIQRNHIAAYLQERITIYTANIAQAS